MKGLFIPEITAEMFRNGCLESIETLMAEGEIYDIEYSPWIPVSERLPEDMKKYYLVTVEFTFSRGDKYITVQRGEEWKNLKSCGHEIIAWMPLPKPYNPTDSEKK